MTQTWGLPSEVFLRMVLWVVVALGGLGILLIVWTTILQWRLDRANAQRIRCFQRWESLVPRYVFGEEACLEELREAARQRPELLRLFLQNCRDSIRGEEYQRVLQLYRKLGLQEGLLSRLRHRSHRQRALAAAEVANFAVDELLPELLPLLKDPHGYVSISAARALSLTGDLAWCAPVMEWVLAQPYYSPERLTGLLECFGPGLIPWMDLNLPPPDLRPEAWCIYARLVGKHHFRHSLPTLLRLLRVDHLELRVAVMRALAQVGEPEALPAIERSVASEEPALREAAVHALAVVAGPRALDALLRLMGDRAYEVRRAASQALAGLGDRGILALEQLAEDAEADPFARDMARERLESIQGERPT